MAGSVEIGSRASSSDGRGKKLLDRAFDALWNAGFDSANATRYVSWMRQYILFHDKRHPQQMGMPEVDAFLASEAFAGPAGTANRAEARRALEFLYEEVLDRRWPRRTKNAAAQRRRVKKAVYLNGQQKDVKLLDRMRNAMRVGQYALDTEKAWTGFNLLCATARAIGTG